MKTRTKTVLKLFIVFIFPAIWALPWPPPPFNSEKIETSLVNGEAAQQEKFHFLTGNDALGASIISKILSIQTYKMPGYICINNKSEIYNDQEPVKRRDLVADNDGGAITIPLFYDDVVTQLVIPFGSSTCSYLKDANLGKTVKVRGFVPISQPEVVSIDGNLMITATQYNNLVTVFKMETTKGYYWNWYIFIKNYFLFLAGWMILLSSVVQVHGWIFPVSPQK